ncbi:MAG: diaminopimelate decarboxylase family protein [Candidatus Heimdallarchaeaceae archaeon]
MKERIQYHDYLSYKNRKLHIYDKDINQIIKQASTPFFLFLPQRFEQNTKYFTKKLEKNLPNMFISYALKANYLGGIMQKVKELNLGAEVMSLFEFKIAEKTGIPYEKIIFNGPAKSKKELGEIIVNKVDFLNVDSFNELKEIEQIAQKKKRVQPILVRIHPDLKDETEKKLLIKKNSKLGIDFSRGIKLLKYAKKSSFLRPIGIHVHVGTNLTSHDFYEELLSFLKRYITDLEKKHNIKIDVLNLGGGLANRTILTKAGFSLEKLGEQIASQLSNIEERTIVFELGRYLVEDSFVAVSKVLRTKKSWGRKWAFLDIGANSLIPMRYTNYSVIPAENKGKSQYCNIGGPLCLPVDVISNEAIDFVVNEEDTIVILNCGAYTISMSEQFGYPRPDVYELTKNIKLKRIKTGDNIEKMVEEAFI